MECAAIGEVFGNIPVAEFRIGARRCSSRWKALSTSHDASATSFARRSRRSRRRSDGLARSKRCRDGFDEEMRRDQHKPADAMVLHGCRRTIAAIDAPSLWPISRPRRKPIVSSSLGKHRRAPRRCM